MVPKNLSRRRHQLVKIAVDVDVRGTVRIATIISTARTMTST